MFCIAPVGLLVLPTANAPSHRSIGLLAKESLCIGHKGIRAHLFFMNKYGIVTAQ